MGSMCGPEAERAGGRSWCLPRLALVLIAVQVVACGGGGGGGGGGDGGPSADADLQVLDVATFLSREAGASPDADPRTAHQVQFIVRGSSNPESRLTDADVEVSRDGRVDVEAHVTLADEATEKSDVTLILDVSGSLTPTDLANVKASAKDLVAELLAITDTLRIYEFASRSETRLLGRYEASGDADSGLTWVPSPTPDIDTIDGGSNSTALFHAVRTAILEDPERDDVIVLFSDGQENSSPEGAREEALELIEDEKTVVFSVGFGSVDPDEMRALSAFGKFLGVRPSLVGLFDEVAREVRSVYTLVYDTPSSFGLQTLEVSIDTGDRRLRFETSLLAGIDLARAAIGRFPTLPGSAVVLSDLRTEPPTVLAYTVAPLERAVRRADGLLAFAIEATPACTSPACGNRFQGVFGAGAEDENGRTYVPAALEEGAEWTDAVSGEALTFLGFADLGVSFDDGSRRQYRCAEVAFSGGTHFFAPGVGLVRTTDGEGNVVVELAAPPCLADSFSGGCTID